MTKKTSRLIYQPPQARDLSAMSACGGMCLDGTALASDWCRDGPAPSGGLCSPNGISPSFGYCDYGNQAVEGCISGTIHI